MIYLIGAGIVIVFLLVIGLIISRMYMRSSKETSFVRTGMGGQKVVKDGGALIFPIVHEYIEVNMNTIVLDIRRENEQALITKDRMRVDVIAEFFVRVKPDADAIADAATTLGQRTRNPAQLRELVEGKFVDALRSVAAEMTMTELHEQRSDFVQKVQNAVTEDIVKNGLELETVSLTGLDQTAIAYFNPENDFDAEGLTLLTKRLELRKKERNEIEKHNQVAIAEQDLDAEKKQLDISKAQEFARLTQQREITLQQEQQKLTLAQDADDKKRETELSRIKTEQAVAMSHQESAALMATDKMTREQQVQLAKLEQEQSVKTETIVKQRELDEASVEAQKTIELAHVMKERDLAIQKQQQEIDIAEKSKELSEMEAQATIARQAQVLAQEELITAQQLEVVNRSKAEALITARQEAEVSAVFLKVGAEAEKQAAEDKAAAARIEAEGVSAAIEIRAQADQVAALANAAGIEAIHQAENKLSPELIQMQIRVKLIDQLPAIIAASTKPLENIDEIKILYVEGGGLLGSQETNGKGHSAESVSMPDALVNSALRFRAQAPLVDRLMQELGVGGSGKVNDISELTNDIMGQKGDVSPSNS